MLSNLFNKDNLETYNVIGVKLFGLEPAIYIEKLASMCAKSHKEVFGDGFYKIDRKYIFNRTNIDPDTQYKYDEILMDKDKDYQLIELYVEGDKEFADIVKFNFEQYTALLTGVSDKVISNIKPIEKKKDDSKKKRIDNLFKCMAYTDDGDIYKALCNWLKMALGKFGAASINELTINDFKNGVINFATVEGEVNKEVAIKVIEIAISMTTKTVKWAIKNYVEQYGNPTKYVQKVATRENLYKANGF